MAAAPAGFAVLVAVAARTAMAVAPAGFAVLVVVRAGPAIVAAARPAIVVAAPAGVVATATRARPFVLTRPAVLPTRAGPVVVASRLLHRGG